MALRAVLVLGLLVIVLAGLAILVGLGVRHAGIRRSRVEAFAWRQRLVVTETNGPHVVRAMAVTHRWRRFGLAVGLLAGLAWAAVHGGLTLNFTTMFLGWFAGAAVAEWRISSLRIEGSRRTADLTPRTMAAYVTVPNRALACASAATVVALGLGAGLRLAAAGASPGPWAAWWVGIAVGAVALVATGRRIVRRPQPAAAPDLIAADDALRGHGLTVLVGSAIAAAGLPIATFLQDIGQPVADAGGSAWTFSAMLALPVSLLVGWFVAGVSPSVRARHRAGRVVNRQREAVQP